jgi:hypothetical protein
VRRFVRCSFCGLYNMFVFFLRSGWRGVGCSGSFFCLFFLHACVPDAMHGRLSGVAGLPGS